MSTDVKIEANQIQQRQILYVGYEPWMITGRDKLLSDILTVPKIPVPPRTNYFGHRKIRSLVHPWYKLPLLKKSKSVIRTLTILL